MFGLGGKKIKCIYCGNSYKEKDGEYCPACGRVTRPMVPVSSLPFVPVDFSAADGLRMTKPGFFKKKAHNALLAACEEGRLRMALVYADGCRVEDISEKEEDDKCRCYQYAALQDGTPIEGQFRRSVAHELRGPTYEPLWILQLESEKGKLSYELITPEEMSYLADTLVNLVGRFGLYEEDRF